MKTDNLLILDNIKRYLEKSPDINFGEVLINLKIPKTINSLPINIKEDPPVFKISKSSEIYTIDKFEQSTEILKRMPLIFEDGDLVYIIKTGSHGFALNSQVKIAKAYDSHVIVEIGNITILLLPTEISFKP